MAEARARWQVIAAVSKIDELELSGAPLRSVVNSKRIQKAKIP